MGWGAAAVGEHVLAEPVGKGGIPGSRFSIMAPVGVLSVSTS